MGDGECTQVVEEAAGQAVWGDAASGVLWAALRCGPAAAPPAQLWSALGTLGHLAPAAAHVGGLLLVPLRPSARPGPLCEVHCGLWQRALDLPGTSRSSLGLLQSSVKVDDGSFKIETAAYQPSA